MKKSCLCIMAMFVVSCGSYPDQENTDSNQNATNKTTSDQVVQTGSSSQTIDYAALNKENFQQLLESPVRSLKWFEDKNMIKSAKTMDGMAKLIADLPKDIEVNLGDLTEKINQQIPLEVTSENFQELLPNIDLAMLVFTMANQAAIDQGFVDKYKNKQVGDIDMNQVIVVVQIIAKIFELFSEDSVNQDGPIVKLLQLLNNPRLNDIKDKIEGILKGTQTPDPDQVYGEESFPDLSQLAELKPFESYEKLRESFAAHTEYVLRTYEDLVTRDAVMSIYKIAYSQMFNALESQK